MFFIAVLALPQTPPVTITVQTQAKPGFYGTNSLTHVTNEILEQSNNFQRNLQPKNNINLQQAIDKLKDLYVKFQNAYSSNSNYPVNVNQQITSVYWDLPRLINDWKDNTQKDFQSDIDRLKYNVNLLFQNLNNNNNGNLPAWSPGSAETAKLVQREILALNEKISQGNWNYVNQNIQNLKQEKQKIAAAYLNSQVISKEVRDHAQNLDNAIDSILNTWNTSRNQVSVARDALQLVSYVDLLLKSLGVKS
jgi:transcription termination factor NusB